MPGQLGHRLSRLSNVAHLTAQVEIAGEGVAKAVEKVQFHVWLLGAIQFSFRKLLACSWIRVADWQFRVKLAGRCAE